LSVLLVRRAQNNFHTKNSIAKKNHGNELDLSRVATEAALERQIYGKQIEKIA